MVYQPAPVALLSVVRSVVHETLAAAGQKPEVYVNTQPPLLEATQLMLDEVLLRQMLGNLLGNLLGNACKYSKQGASVKVNIDMQSAPNGDEPQLRIVVADHGIGIPADDLPLLFESFHRAANAVNLPGTGLGLAIVDRAVRAHGGRISVRSVEGQGTQFELVLPWRPAAG